MIQQRLLSPAQRLLRPLARVPLPLMDGLTRRRLTRRGVEQHDVRLTGSVVHYYYLPRRAGGDNAAPVLLVHGIADSALTWAFVINELAQEHDVYAVDLPGYGLSSLPPQHASVSLAEMRDVLVSFIEEVIGRPALVVGNSLGGWLAFAMAWAAPSRVRGVVPINPGGAPLNGPESWESFRELLAARDLRAARTIFQQLAYRMPPPLIYVGQWGLQESFQRQVVQEFITLIREDEFLRAEDVRHVPVPAALIWGLADYFLPAGSFKFFRDNLPDAPKLLLEQCGHLPQRECPHAVAQFVRAFAAQVRVAPHARSGSV
ncbi:MAG TPA: alpha/beta hydrolase [Roseiflexaceae bacterium]|nr:alpha/beta hydrolase [Roseiflexaceae bacterium]